jgi:hypothetical protein
MVNAYRGAAIQSSLLTPNRNITFPEFETLDWKDVTPKMGTYDLTGDGKTALRCRWEYVLGQSGRGRQQSVDKRSGTGLVTMTTRNWSDFFLTAFWRTRLNGECGPG